MGLSPTRLFTGSRTRTESSHKYSLHFKEDAINIVLLRRPRGLLVPILDRQVAIGFACVKSNRPFSPPSRTSTPGIKRIVPVMTIRKPTQSASECVLNLN